MRDATALSGRSAAQRGLYSERMAPMPTPRLNRYDLRLEIESILQELMIAAYMAPAAGSVPESPQSVAERILKLVERITERVVE